MIVGNEVKNEGINGSVNLLLHKRLSFLIVPIACNHFQQFLWLEVGKKEETKSVNLFETFEPRHLIGKESSNLIDLHRFTADTDLVQPYGNVEQIFYDL